MKTIANMQELHFQLLPHSPYLPHLVPSGFSLFPALKKMLVGKGFESNKEEIAESEAYFGVQK